MSISADSPSDETLNRGPLALLLRREYEFPFGINIVQFSFFFSMIDVIFLTHYHEDDVLVGKDFRVGVVVTHFEEPVDAD